MSPRLVREFYPPGYNHVAGNHAWGTDLLGPVVLPFFLGSFSRAGSGTYRTGATSIVTAGSNVLRLEDLGDGNGSAYLFEGATTNLFRYRKANDYSNKNAVVINVDGGTSLLDARDQDSVDYGLVAPNHQIFDNPGSTFANDTFTHSIWAKVLSGTNTSQNFGCNVSNENLSIAVTTSPSDWTFFSATGALNGEFIGQLMRDNAVETKTWLWDAHQVEALGFPTSYVDVAGSATARAPDIMSFATYADVMRLGRWKMRWDPKYAHGEAEVTHTLLDFDSAVTENNVYFDQATNSIRIRVNGVQVLSQALTFSRNPWVELAFDWVARELTITGATTGDGTYAITGVANWPANTLYWAARHDGSSPDYARFTEPRAW